MSRYTCEAVETEAKALGAGWLDHHDCSLCGVWVGYHISGDGVTFDPACGCSWSPGRQVGFGEIADWLAMQSSDEIRDRILKGWRVSRGGARIMRTHSGTDAEQ